MNKKMKKIRVLGLIQEDCSSHTIRVLEIAKAMRETGDYEILFSGQGPYMKLVENAGFKWTETRGLDRETITSDVNRNQNLGKLKEDKDILQLIYKPA